MVQKRLYFLLTTLFLLVGISVFADDSDSDIGTASGSDVSGIPASTAANYVYEKNATSPEWKPLTNRRALVGYGCEINRLISSVNVGSWRADVNAVVDTDLDNYMTLPSLLEGDVAYEPIISVRDMKRVYSAGTKAGFIIAGGASLLKLGIANFYAIQFFKDGKPVGDIWEDATSKKKTSAVVVSNGLNASGISLGLIENSNPDVSIEVSVNAPADFDEVAFVLCGVSLDVIGNSKIKYAFVGDAKSFMISQNGMDEYFEYKGRDNIKKDFYYDGLNIKADESHTGQNVVSNKSVLVTCCKSALDGLSDYTWWSGRTLYEKLIDDGDAGKETGVLISEILKLGPSLFHACVRVDAADGDEAFPAGTEIAFHYESGAALEVKLLNSTEINFYDKDGNRLSTETIDATGVGLGVIGTTRDGVVRIKAKNNFSRATFYFTGINVNLGYINANYAEITLPPDIDHHCNLGLSYTVNPCTNDYVLLSSDENVNWLCSKHPDFPEEKPLPTVSETGVIEGLIKDSDGNILYPGEYEFTAIAADGCTEKITIFIGNVAMKLYSQSSALINKEFDGDGKLIQTYVASNFTYDSEGMLVSIGPSSCDDVENLVNPSIDDFAERIPGIKVAQNEFICGVKMKDESAKLGTSEQKIKRIGFIVETRTNALDLNLLDFFCIKAFDVDGKLIVGIDNAVGGVGKATDEFTVLSTGLIGQNKVQKIRLSVAVPETVGDKIHSVELWRCGITEVSFNKLKIYYAFADTDDTPYDYLGMEVLSYKNGASLKANGATTTGGALDVANVLNNLTFIIDEDDKLETPALIGNTVSASGTTIGVKLGRTCKKGTQVGVVIKNGTYLADVELGSWITLAAYGNITTKNEETGETTTTHGKVAEKHDWDVLTANVIGGGDKRLLYLTPQEDFDELYITFAGIVSGLEYIQVYGVFLRSDVDEDGVPDAIDDNSCRTRTVMELLLNEDEIEGLYDHKGRDYKDAILALHRTFSKSFKVENEREVKDLNIWNSFILPVNLTGLQFRTAFGNKAQLAEAIGQKTDGDNRLIHFKLVDTSGDGTVVNAGTFYLIKVMREPDVVKTDTYVTSDPVEHDEYGNPLEVNGEVYIIQGGVNYTNGLDKNVDIVDFYGKNELEKSINFRGTYYKQTFPAGSYAFSGGEMYITDRVNTMKGFRFWIDPSSSSSDAKSLSFIITDDENGLANIYNVVNGELVNSNDNVYDIGGRRITNVKDFNMLRRGMYIVKGKKVLVK